MMKWLRKYNTQLLAVAASALLVVWLGGDALTSALQPDQTKNLIGTSRTGDIRQVDLQIAEGTSELQRMVNLNWKAEFSAGGQPLSEIDWILLMREAEALGIEVTPEQAHQRLVQGMGMPQDFIDRLAIQRDVTKESIYAAAAQYMEVRDLFLRFRMSLAIPETELRAKFQDYYAKAEVEAVVLPADKFVDEEATFSEEEIEAQFAAYKDKLPGQGQLDFGYYVPAKVKVQWVEVDPKAIQESLTNSSEYRRRAYQYWKDNRDDRRFRKPPEASTNGAPPAVGFYETFEGGAEDVAIEVIKEEEAKTLAANAARELIGTYLAPWTATTTAPNQFKPAPDVVQRLDWYKEGIERVKTLTPETRDAAISVHVLEDPMTVSELRTLEGIGSATVEVGDRPQGVADIAFNVQGLVEYPTNENADRSLFLSKWQTFQFQLMGRNGRSYVFRVVDVAPGHEPESVDEVRDAVIADLRLKQGMDKAYEAAEQFAEKAAGAESLRTAYEEDTELSDRFTPSEAGGYTAPRPFARVQSYVPSIGMVGADFMDAAFELANAGAEESPVKVIKLDDEASTVVLKGKRYFPVYKETYEARRSGLRGQLYQQQIMTAMVNWFDSENIRSRNQYKSAS